MEAEEGGFAYFSPSLYPRYSTLTINCFERLWVAVEAVFYINNVSLVPWLNITCPCFPPPILSSTSSLWSTTLCPARSLVRSCLALLWWCRVTATPLTESSTPPSGCWSRGSSFPTRPASLSEWLLVAYIVLASLLEATPYSPRKRRGF